MESLKKQKNPKEHSKLSLWIEDQSQRPKGYFLLPVAKNRSFEGWNKTQTTKSWQIPIPSASLL